MNIKGLVRGARILSKYTRNSIGIVLSYLLGRDILVKCSNHSYEIRVKPNDILYISPAGYLCALLRNNVMTLKSGNLLIGNCEVDLRSTVLHSIFEVQEYIQKGDLELYCHDNKYSVIVHYNGLELKLETLYGFNGLSEIKEMFFDGVYSVFEYSGKKVLDVGVLSETLQHILLQTVRERSS